MPHTNKQTNAYVHQNEMIPISTKTKVSKKSLCIEIQGMQKLMNLSSELLKM